jgi:hypothetical protein
MAYNPFDDIIDSDPAYMQTGGTTVIPQRRADYTQETFKPIATAISKGYQLLTPEQETKDEIEKNKQLRQLATAQALKGTQFEEYAGQADLPSAVIQSPGIMERLQQAGYKPQGFIEGMSRIGEFFYGDQRQAFDKLSQGQQLTDQDRTAIALSPLDSLDFLFPPLAIKKLGSMGLKTVDDVLKSTADIEEVKQIKNYFGGQGFTPSGVVRAPDDGGAGGKLSQKEVASLGGKATQEKIRIAKEPSIQKIKNFFNENKDKYIGIGVEKFIDDAKKSISFSEQDPVFSKTTSGIRKDIESFAPEVLKQVQSYYTPQFIVREADLSLSSSPLDQFVKKYSDSFFEIVGRRPTQTELQNHIINTGPEEAKDYFAKSGYSKAMAASNPRYKDLIKPRPKTKLIDRVTEIGKTNPEFESNFNIALANLKQSDAKTNTIKNQYNILMKPYTDNNLEKPFSYESFGKYVRGQEDIPTRQKRLDLEDYESPLASKKKQNRNYKRVAKQITNKLTAFNITGALPRFLKHQYRSMISPNLRGRMLSGDEYMKKYIDPYVVYKKNNKGKDVVDKKATEEKFRLEYPNFAKWENMEKRIINYDAKLNEFVDRLAIDGQYTELELDRIKSALEPQRSHEYNIDQLLKKNRMINVSENPDLVRVQPKVINMVYQPVYDSALRKIFNIIEKADSLEQLKTMKPKAIYIPKKSQINANINVDVKDFNNQYDYLDAIYRQIDGAMKARGMVGHYDFNPKNKEILKGFKFDRDDQLGELISVGSKKKFTADDYLERMEDILNMIGYKKMVKNNFIQFKKGGAVKMAKGGLDSVLENMNQQNFTPDPAIDGDSAFQKAVKSENLYAFNPSKILKFFGDKVPGVFTPSKRNKNMELVSDAPSAPGTTLPVEQPIQDYDFAFKSFTLDKINSKNAPKAAKPQDWINFLQGGDIAPKAEILDSGLFQYMEDFERYYPNQKLTREQITEFYEQSPISNLQVKVKAGRDDASPYDVMSQETMGRARHKNAGNVRIDEGGENYREIVIEAGALPGEEKPFISSGHFEEPNVLVFSRVADYKNADGQNVSVIQEMQTDLLTKVRKEQERLAAAIGEAKVKLAANQRVIEQGDAFDNYRMDSANKNIQQLSQQIPKLEQLAETKLIKPYPLTVAKELIPTYEKQLLDLQQEINALAQAGVDRTDPEFLMKISQIEQQQQGTLNELLNLNRSKNFETLTQDVKVPTASNSEELQQIAQNQSSYHNTRPIETFPPIPFNNQADYVDLILKATIKDAENRGVNKIAIMPADVGANPRWSKNNEDARKKFQNLYDKVGVQQLKNIAKKYGGSVEIEKISDPTKSTMGLKVSKPSLNRDSFDFLKDVDVDRRAVENDPEGARNFLDEEIIRIASDLGDKSVIYRKETAPGQTMDYYVDLYTVNTDRETVKKYNLVPLDPDDVDTNAQILIEDYNPSLVDMFVLTMDEGKQKAPMYMFKKKEGGIIPEDRLVSITDIYGDY